LIDMIIPAKRVINGDT